MVTASESFICIPPGLVFTDEAGSFFALSILNHGLTSFEVGGSNALVDPSDPRSVVQVIYESESRIRFRSGIPDFAISGNPLREPKHGFDHEKGHIPRIHEAVGEEIRKRGMVVVDHV